MSNNPYLRQIDFFDPKNFRTPVHIIGCGGLGSAIALLMAKMGFFEFAELTLWDHDEVEAHNVANQLAFERKHIGLPKVQALAEVIRNHTDPFKIDEKQMRLFARCPDSEKLLAGFSGVVIMALDNLSTREHIWKKLKHNPNVRLLIDPRIGGHHYRALFVEPFNPEDFALIEGFLGPGATPTVELPCSARSIIYVPTFLASLVTQTIGDWHQGRRYYRHIFGDLSSGMNERFLPQQIAWAN